MWEQIASQGGFAVLAAFAIGTILQIAKMWVADIKASAERERLLTSKVLDLLAQVTAAIAEHSGKISGLTTEIQGLRSIAHTIGNAVADFPALDLRLARLERVEGSETKR